MNIFVSYTTRNNEVTINSLVDLSNKLNSFGKVFIDLLDNDSADKQQRVIDELERSDLLILIKSLSTLDSEWVTYEVIRAKDLNIPIIELSISELDDISGNELNEKVSQISYFQMPQLSVASFLK